METLRFEEEDNIGILTLSREKQLNAINLDMLHELESTLEALKLSDIRCLIITGEGEKSFVAGADIKAMSVMTDEEAKAFSLLGTSIMTEIETFDIPVIAAVNGYALGGGCEMALSCDMVIASENAIFGQPEVTLGVTPGFGGTQRLQRAVGRTKAKELILTGESISAKDAFDYGIVDKVVERGKAVEEAKMLALKIAKNPPMAVRSCKKAIDYLNNKNIADGIKEETAIFSRCFSFNEQKKQMKLFLDKRKK